MRILAATGGAPHSDEAVRLGGSIQQLTGGELTVLTVIKQETEREQGEAVLAQAEGLVTAVAMQTRLRIGRPAEEIIREVEASGYDLLVIGERAHHGLARRLLAPTAEKLVARMPCPVLIARGKVRPLQRALVCESGRIPSLLTRLINQLSPLLRHVDELTVLHVMSQMAAAPGVSGWELRADAQELIEKHTPEGSLLEDHLIRLEQLNVRLAAKVRHGLVVKEILAEARSGDYDLVVIGAHQSKGWERFLLDDLAHDLINHADRPLLVI
ncbi:MAG: universal stress protein [Anaerolinea sp.]|nr:universal stress protein [Anaerolinea sp.]